MQALLPQHTQTGTHFGKRRWMRIGESKQRIILKIETEMNIGLAYIQERALGRVFQRLGHQSVGGGCVTVTEKGGVGRYFGLITQI